MQNTHAEDRRSQAAGSAKSATPVRLLVAQDDNAERHEHECKQCANVTNKSDSVPISRMPAGMPTRNPAIHVAVAGVRKRGCTRPNILGSKPSTRHREPHPRLSPLKHQQRRDHAHHGAEQHGQLRPVQQRRFRCSRQHAHGRKLRRRHRRVSLRPAAEQVLGMFSETTKSGCRILRSKNHRLEFRHLQHVGREGKRRLPGLFSSLMGESGKPQLARN